MGAMVDLVSEVPASSQKPLELAAEKAHLAHHALGRMSASVTTAEFRVALYEFLATARNVARLVEQAAEGSPHDARRRAFTSWFGERTAVLSAHPIENGLDRKPVVYASRHPRGSGPPPIADLPKEPEPTARPRPDDYFFEQVQSKPAIALCAEYLDRITELLDQSKWALARR